MAKLSPLFGIPIVIKECFEMEGMPYTGGIVGRTGIVGKKISTTVEQAINHGMIVLGTSNISEGCTVCPALLGKDPTDQSGLDQLMLDLDGTPNKTNLGANAILGASLAISKAGASAKGVPLFKHYADLAGISIYFDSNYNST